MNYRLLVCFVAAASLYGQRHSPDDVLRTWFGNGVALEIHTESSGANTPLSTSGSVMVDGSNVVQRGVIGKNAVAIFAYNIEARKLPDGAVSLRVFPMDQEQARKRYPKQTGAIPTVSGTRDFGPLRAGDAIELDILYNPTTQEKIYDVLRVSDAPPPVVKPDKARGNQFSFQEVKLVINGVTVRESRNNWIIGEAAAIHIPGRGNFYLTLNPTPNYPFKASGWVDHNILRMPLGNDLVEIIGKSNILQKSEYGTVWIYQESDPSQLAAELSRLSRTLAPNHPRIKALQRQLEDLPKGFSIDTADEVEMLIPKAGKQEE